MVRGFACRRQVRLESVLPGHLLVARSIIPDTAIPSFIRLFGDSLCLRHLRGLRGFCHGLSSSVSKLAEAGRHRKVIVIRVEHVPLDYTGSRHLYHLWGWCRWMPELPGVCPAPEDGFELSAAVSWRRLPGAKYLHSESRRFLEANPSIPKPSLKPRHLHLSGARTVFDRRSTTVWSRYDSVTSASRNHLKANQTLDGWCLIRPTSHA